MMAQHRLDEFATRIEVASTRPGSETTYAITKGPDGISCTCDGWRKRAPHVCIHVYRELYETSEARARYLEERAVTADTSRFKTFEAALAHLRWGGDSEETYLANLILVFGYTSATVTSDDVYEAVGGRFTSYKRLGQAFRVLADNGLIWAEPVMVHSRRPRNHGRKLHVWHLTDLGRDIMEHIRGRIT